VPGAQQPAPSSPAPSQQQQPGGGAPRSREQQQQQQQQASARPPQQQRAGGDSGHISFGGIVATPGAASVAENIEAVGAHSAAQRAQELARVRLLAPSLHWPPSAVVGC
jgi:hypothetical protein